MHRRLLKLAAAISLVLLIATAALWVRSYFVCEHIAHARMQGAATLVRSSQGAIYFDRRSFWSAAGGWTWGRRRIYGGSNALAGAYQAPSWNSTVLGVGAFGGTAYMWPGHLYVGLSLPPQTDSRWWKDNYTAVRIPFWVLVLAFAIAPTRYLFRVYRERAQRRRAGRCRRCFYDLTGNVSGVCPECGSSVVT